MRFTGWDRGIGTLLGAILAGRAKSQDTESLRKILDQQRRRGRTMDDMSGIESGSIPMDMATDQEGMFGNAPWTSPQDTPYIPNSQFPQVEQSGGFLGSLGDALSTAGRYALEGFTPGNAEAGPLATQVRDARRANERKQNLADAIALAKAKAQNRAPGFTERMYEDYARIHGPEAAMDLWKANQQGGTSDLLAGQLRNNPQAMQDWLTKQTTTPPRSPSSLEELKANMTDEQWQEYIKNKARPPAKPSSLEELLSRMTEPQREQYLAQRAKGGGSRPAVREESGNLIGRDPTTGEELWRQEGAALRPLPASESGKLGAAKSLYEMATKVQQQYADPAGGLDAYLGPVAGRTSTLNEKYGGAVPGLKTLPKNAVEFRRNVTSIGTLLAQMRSGLQISDQEYERLSRISPAITDPPSTFAGKLSGFLDEIRSLHTNKIDAFGEYRIPERLRSLDATAQQVPVISPQTPQTIPSGPLKGMVVDTPGTAGELQKELEGMSLEQLQQLRDQLKKKAPRANPR